MDQGLRNPVQYYDQAGNNSAMNGFATGNSFPSPAASNVATMPGGAYGIGYRENGMGRYPEQVDLQNCVPSTSPFAVSQYPNQRNIPDSSTFEKTTPNQNNFGQRRKMETANGNYQGGFDPSFINKQQQQQRPGEMDPNFSSTNFQHGRINPRFNNANQSFQSPTHQNPYQFQPGMPQGQAPGMEFMMQQQQQQQQQFQNFNRQDFTRLPQQQMPEGMFPPSDGVNPDSFSMMTQQGLQNDPNFNQAAQNSVFPNPGRSQSQQQIPPSSTSNMPGNFSDPSRFNLNSNSPQSNKPNDQGSAENQNQAALMAAAAVRAAAAASARQRSGFHTPQSTPNSFNYGQRRMSPHDASGSPFGSQLSGLQSPNSVKDFRAMSPAADSTHQLPFSSSSSPFGQRGMSHPPPYSSADGGAKPIPVGVSQLPPQKPGGPVTPVQKVVKQELRRSSSDSASPRPQRLPDVGDIGDQGGLLSDIPPVEGMDAIIDSVASEGDLQDNSNPLSDRLSVNNTREQERKSLISPTNRSSAPPTPLSGISGMSPVPSPFQEDLELDSLSPSWPQAPSSPGGRKLMQSQSQSQSPSRFDQLSKLYELSDDEERRDFLDKYLAFMSINGTPVTKVPIVSKQPLDLYRLCRLMIERGGLQEVIKKKRFREILRGLNLTMSNSSTALTIKNQYIKYLLPYENKMKDPLLKKWQVSQITSATPPPSSTSFGATGAKPNSTPLDVPTIALNDSMKDVSRNSATAPLFQNNAFQPRPQLPNQQMMPGFRPEWDGFPGNSNPGMNYPPQAQGVPGYMPHNNNPFMGGPGRPPMNPQGGPMYPDQGMYPASMGNEMPFPAGSYPSYQQQMMMRQQNMYMAGQQNAASTLTPNMPHDMTMTPGAQWQRQLAGRGPPELYPEGLQRPPWLQPQAPQPQTMQQQPRMPVPQTKTEQFDLTQQGFQSPVKESKDHTAPLKEFTQPPTQKPKTQMIKKPAHPSHHLHAMTASKNEPSPYPPNCVESTKPSNTRKRKWTSKQLGPVEAWRIMMSLKSGLLAECTWAIDALNILLYDNQTITYFHLAQLPGLLDTLADHYRRCLKDLFGLDHIVELPTVTCLKPNTESIQNKLTVSDKTKMTSKDLNARNELLNTLWIGVCRNALQSYSSNVAASAVIDADGKTEGFESGSEQWTLGGGDDTSHILMSFPNTHIKLQTYPGIMNCNEDDGVLTCKFSGKCRKLSTDVDYQEITTGTSICRTCNLKSVLIEDIATFLPSQSKHPSNLDTRNKLKRDDAVTVEKKTLSVGSKPIMCKTEKESSSTDDNSECKIVEAVVEIENVKKEISENDKGKEECMEHEPERVSKDKEDMQLSNVTKTKQILKNGEDKQTCVEEKSSQISQGDTDKQEGIESQPHSSEGEETPKSISSEESFRIQSNLDHCENFIALEELMKEVKEKRMKSESKDDEDSNPLLQQIQKDLISDSDCNASYLESSRQFIGYLRKRLKHENRGQICCDESVSNSLSAFTTSNDSQEFRLRRCVALSNIFRSLSFISGNDTELAGHPGLLLLTGSLLLLEHHHPIVDHSEFRLGQEDHAQPSDQLKNIVHDSGWWWDGLLELRENALVVLANVAGHLDLSHYQEKISLPIIDGLLHWLVCQSSEARDSMPTAPEAHALSPKRLALEALAKLSIKEGNVDLILATPPSCRLEKVFNDLIFGIGIKSCVPSREFCVVLLDNLAHGENAPQLIASQRSSLSKLLSFLEEAETNTTTFLSSGGVVQPGLSAEEVCGTSVNMLRRAADVLLCLARIVSNRTLFLPYMDRLLALSMSQMMDTSVLSILGEVMFELR